MKKKWFFIAWNIKYISIRHIKGEVTFMTDEEIIALIDSKTGHSQGHIRRVELYELTNEGKRLNREDLVEKVFKALDPKSVSD
jgi:hypothetical protein